jgi:hypothetical protein
VTHNNHAKMIMVYEDEEDGDNEEVESDGG